MSSLITRDKSVAFSQALHGRVQQSGALTKTKAKNKNQNKGNGEEPRAQIRRVVQPTTRSASQRPSICVSAGMKGRIIVKWFAITPINS